MSEELEIIAAWGNSNFGPKGDTHDGRVSLIVEALGGVARGYSAGSFMMAIISELGMTKIRNGQKSLSDKGLHWLITRTNNDESVLQAQVDEMKAKMGDYEKLLELSYIALHEAGESRVLTFKISEALTSPTTTDTPEG